LTGIVIDGLDFVGKSTLANSLAILAGTRVVESPQGAYRSLLRGPAQPVSSASRLALYVAANIELGMEFAGTNSPVIVVRHLFSTVIHHSLANGESSVQCLRDLDYLLRHCPQPSAIIIVEAAHQERVRRAAKAVEPLSECDNWTLDPETHVKIENAYHELADMVAVPVLYLDTTNCDVNSTALSAYSWLKSRDLV
jgi:thymidylate kinase